MVADRMALSELPYPVSVKRSVRNVSLEQLGNRRAGDSSAIAHLLDGRLRLCSAAIPGRKGTISSFAQFANDASPGDHRTDVPYDVGRKPGRYAVGSNSTSRHERFRHLSHAPVLPNHSARANRSSEN